ncbi:hypothetical protein KVF89_18925 [Nocardioides carbamazepini]|uniref:hypothetical protein n=1 Tax=Nocardioides carbamazepini TaxID=2854259 RepID=UPI00214A8612|nr:hypothetical protein [Nocardioides carbamazepini]MCR1784625.1 hypothetical protein [Nocardioides carbamazepini]
MKSRNDAERLAYARMLAGLEVTGMLFATRVKRARAARDLLFEEMVPRLIALGVTELVIESCQEDAEDRRLLRRLLGPAPELTYRHGSKSDLLLSLPDILAWAHGRGGRFRDAVKPVTTDHGRFGGP